MKNRLNHPVVPWADTDAREDDWFGFLGDEEPDEEVSKIDPEKGLDLASGFAI